MSPTYCGSHHVLSPFGDSVSGSDMNQGGDPEKWKMDEDSGHKEDSDSDELDHMYYLWSDYDSYFFLITGGVPVSCKKKYHTYLEIFLDQLVLLHCTRTYCFMHISTLKKTGDHDNGGCHGNGSVTICDRAYEKGP